MFEAGDIFLCDSDKIGAKIVKFLMTAPTVWQYLWRWMRGTQQPVRYFHAGMILDDMYLIEQQGKVQIDGTPKIMFREVIVYRRRHLSLELKDLLETRARSEVGEGYDLILIIGKTLTWITGLKFFTDFLGWLSRNEEICVSRVAHWYDEIESFGVRDHSEITTKIMDEFCSNSENWELVYQCEGGKK